MKTDVKKSLCKRQFSVLFHFMFILFIFSFGISAKAETTWPKVITVTNGVITVYQPQPETLDGTLLSGRAAISVKHKDSNRATFGAIWITADLEVDRDTRIAVLNDIKIPHIRFSDDLDSVTVLKISKIIEEEMPKWELEITIDDLITTLESSSTSPGNSYKNDAPEIIVSYKPSILIFIDGKPILKKIDGYNFQRIENSPFFIVFDEKKSEYYIYSETHWVASTDLNGKWEMLKKESKELKKLRDEILKANPPEDQAASAEPPTIIPDVIVRTQQAELIAFDGEPKFKPIETTNLLYVENTTSDVFMDIQSQKYFVLVSGRWYSAKEISGPWAFIEADKLPADFSKIPAGSEKDNVLASVAGTDAAREAILDAQIPQTAEVNRKTTTVNVEYDGEPKFEKVDGTSMLYAVNSPQTVLKVGGKFYCVDNGIWFEAPTAKGVWAVTDTRPAEVDKIEPSSSVYNVKYVYVYESTPEVVYVGYTPGYYGSYVYGPTVIYGTGYRYYPWYGAYYYPRPVTYGFSMHYNPWTGWGIGFGMYYGPVHISYWGGHYGHYGGYYGCGAYRPPYHYHGGGYYGHGGYHPGYYPGYGNNRPGYGGSNRPGTGSGNRPEYGQRPSTGTRPSNNIYGNNRAGVNPTVSNKMATGTSGSNRGDRTSQRPANNVYTDKSGNVYKKTDKGWEQRQGNDWKSADKTPKRSTKAESTTSNRSNTGAANTGNRAGTSNVTNRDGSGTSVNRSAQPNYNRSELDRQATNRDRGTSRNSNYNNYSGGQKSGISGAQRSGGGTQRSGVSRSGGGRR
jgi:hypothetical protein